MKRPTLSEALSFLAVAALWVAVILFSVRAV